MTLLFMDGFGNTAAGQEVAYGWTSTNPNMGRTTGRYGDANGALTRASGGPALRKDFTTGPQATSDTVYFGLALSKMDTVTGVEIFEGAGVTLHIGIYIDANGYLVVKRGGSAGTLLATSTLKPPPAGNWWHLSGKVKVHDTLGEVVLKINSVEAINIVGTGPSPLDTRNGGANGYANSAQFFPGATGNCIIDDLWIDSAVDHGDCRVYHFYPTGQSGAAVWTPSAGNNWACVDEATHNTDTDYVSSATPGQSDLYTVGDMPAGFSGAVKAVETVVWARKDDAGARSIALLTKSGGTTDQGPTESPGTTYLAYRKIYDVNPDDAAAWEKADVDAVEIGVHLEA